jgi:hypothetical protein
MRDIEGFRLSVAATDSNGELTRLSDSGALVIEQNNFVRVTGSGFLAGSDAVGWLFSDPYRLGLVKVGGDGTFEASLPLGNEIEIGRHTVQVNGVTARGEVRSLNLAVELVEESAIIETDANGSSGSSDLTQNTLAPKAIGQPREVGTGQSSGWIGLLMLLMLIVSYLGEAPLIDARRRLSHVLSALLDDALSLRMLGSRRYALSAAGAALVVSSLLDNEFIPTYPAALGFVALMTISAIDPFAGFVSALTLIVGVLAGGGAAGADAWRAALVVAATYVLTPMAASSVARRLKKSAGIQASIGVASVVYLVTGYSATRITGALLRAELSIDRLVLLLMLLPTAAFAVRFSRDQQYERANRGSLRLRRMNVTLGLVPIGLALLAFVVLSDVLIDDESLLTLLVLGVVVGIRKLHLGKPAPRSASPSRSRRAQDTSRPTRRPPASRTE